jgi:hypothetical protein
MTIAMYSRTSWRDVEPDFTVGQTDGEFTGTIERIDARFHATTNVGEALGSFRSREAAERALERSAAQRGQQSAEPARSARDAALLKAAALMAGIAATGAAGIIAAVTL